MRAVHSAGDSLPSSDDARVAMIAVRHRLIALALLAGSALTLPRHLRPRLCPLALVGGTLYQNPTDQPIRDAIV